MSETKKRRGRPVGTDYKQDKIALDLVAEHLVANGGLRPMTAMKAVFGTKAFSGPGYTQIDTTVARWQVKWKRRGQAALIAARERVQRTRTPQPHRNDVTASTPLPYSIWGMSTEAKQVIAAAAALTPSADLLRAIKLGSRGPAAFRKAQPTCLGGHGQTGWAQPSSRSLRRELGCDEGASNSGIGDRAVEADPQFAGRGHDARVHEEPEAVLALARCGPPHRSAQHRSPHTGQCAGSVICGACVCAS